MSYEDEARIIMNKFAKQQQAMAENIKANPGKPNENFSSPANPIEQSILTNLQNNPAPAPVSLPDACPQCGTIHPPIPQGQKCPNASLNNKVSGTGLNDTIIGSHLVNMRDIIISQMSIKKVKDGNKFFAYAILELTKALEKYNE